MLRAEGLSKSFGARVLLAAIDLHVHPADRIGLVGRNGEGKTTLLRLLSGQEHGDSGSLVLRRGARVGYLRQEVDPSSECAVIEEVRTVQEPILALERQLRALEHEIEDHGAAGGEVRAELAQRYDAASEEFRARGGFEADADLRSTLAGLGFDPDRWQAPLRTLSGGWLMRVELAKLLLARPEVLLLDEPTNHLDLPSIAWFEGVIRSYPGALVVVSHDRTFLDRHATRIAELDRGRLNLFSGNYSDYVRQKAERERVSTARREHLDKQISHAQKFVDRFRAKATKATQAQSRLKKIEKLAAERDTLVAPEHRKDIRLRFKSATRSGDLVLRLDQVDKAYDEKTVYRGLDFEMRRGQRVALVGPNGAGKSTLLRIASGSIPPQAGVRELGHNVEMAFYAQHQLDSLNTRNTVLQEVESEASLEETPRVRGLLGGFLFSGDDVEKKISVLSGGEKARVALAKLLLGHANFLVLDEPTNHLDIQARDVLVRALEDYDGTLLFISHDRDFINRLASEILEVRPGDGAAEIERFPGNFDEYEQRTSGVEPSAAAPSVAKPDQAERRQQIQQQRRHDKAIRAATTAIQTAEAEIERLESDLERLGWLCADPEVARDGERLREIQSERQAVQLQLDAQYTDWERSSGELESLQGAATDESAETSA